MPRASPGISFLGQFPLLGAHSSSMPSSCAYLPPPPSPVQASLLQEALFDNPSPAAFSLDFAPCLRRFAKSFNAKEQRGTESSSRTLGSCNPAEQGHSRRKGRGLWVPGAVLVLETVMETPFSCLHAADIPGGLGTGDKQRVSMGSARPLSDASSAPQSDHFLLGQTSPLGMVGIVLRPHMFLGPHENLLISSEVSRKNGYNNNEYITHSSLYQSSCKV